MGDHRGLKQLGTGKYRRRFELALEVSGGKCNPVIAYPPAQGADERAQRPRLNAGRGQAGEELSASWPAAT